MGKKSRFKLKKKIGIGGAGAGTGEAGAGTGGAGTGVDPGADLGTGAGQIFNVLDPIKFAKNLTFWEYCLLREHNSLNNLIVV